MILLLALACVPEPDQSRLPPLADSPVVPPVEEAEPTGESRAFELDFGGGGAGAPWGMALFVPPGAEGSVETGRLEDGVKGVRFTVPVAGESVLCSTPVQVVGSFRFAARMKVEAVGPTAEDWMGLHVEMRARDAGRALVSPAGARFHRLRHWREATPGWVEWEETVEVPPGATQAELCWRFVQTTGTVALDRFVVETPGVPVPPPVPIVSVAWSLDRPGGGGGAPEGFDFLLPPGTEGATLTAGPVGDGQGLRMAVDRPGNALACSQPFAVAPGMVVRARVKVEAVRSDERPWTGFVAEVRTYDVLGGLVSPAGQAFTFLASIKAPSDWQAVEVPFAPPAGASVGKLCFRFVEATGVAMVDEAGVGE